MLAGLWLLVRMLLVNGFLALGGVILLLVCLRTVAIRLDKSHSVRDRALDAAVQVRSHDILR